MGQTSVCAEYWHSQRLGDFVKDKNEEPTEDEKRRAKWRLLINELGINGCGEFEALVVEFLESGLFDASKLAPIIDRYVAEKHAVEARERPISSCARCTGITGSATPNCWNWPQSCPP